VKPATKSFHSKGLDFLMVSPVPVIIPVPFVVLSSVIVPAVNVRPVEVIAIVITSPVCITFRAAIIITPVRISCCVYARAGINDE